jgi:hypothetical protein
LDFRTSDLDSAQIAQPRLRNDKKVINEDRRKIFWKKYKKYGIHYLLEEEGVFNPRFYIKLKWKIDSLKKDFSNSSNKRRNND